MTNKMNSQVKQLWVEALRSGLYKQGIGVLRNTENEYCCLGVLCDIYDDQGWGQPNDYMYPYFGSEGFLPLKVQEWAGITNEGQLISAEDHTLVHFNDTGSSFTEIADFIEENF
jgi:hypothetical protein